MGVVAPGEKKNILVVLVGSDNFLVVSTLFLKRWLQVYDKTDDLETLGEELANVIMNHLGVNLEELNKITQNPNSL